MVLTGPPLSTVYRHVLLRISRAEAEDRWVGRRLSYRQAWETGEEGRRGKMRQEFRGKRGVLKKRKDEDRNTLSKAEVVMD